MECWGLEETLNFQQRGLLAEYSILWFSHFDARNHHKTRMTRMTSWGWPLSSRFWTLETVKRLEVLPVTQWELAMRVRHGCCTSCTFPAFAPWKEPMGHDSTAGWGWWAFSRWLQSSELKGFCNGWMSGWWRLVSMLQEKWLDFSSTILVNLGAAAVPREADRPTGLNLKSLPRPCQSGLHQPIWIPDNLRRFNCKFCGVASSLTFSCFKRSFGHVGCSFLRLHPGPRWLCNMDADLAQTCSSLWPAWQWGLCFGWLSQIEGIPHHPLHPTHLIAVYRVHFLHQGQAMSGTGATGSGDGGT